MHGADMDKPVIIADEVQKVAPWAVTGEPGAVGKDGKPVMQQFSQGAMVEVLIAEVKGLRQRVKLLEAANDSHFKKAANQ